MFGPLSLAAADRILMWFRHFALSIVHLQQVTVSQSQVSLKKLEVAAAAICRASTHKIVLLEI